MKPAWCGLLALLPAVLHAAVVPPPRDGITVTDASREAYSQPVPGLPADSLPAFLRGRSLFRQVWVVPPALDVDIAGLGPVFNRPSCAACHLKNGRGRPPERHGDRMLSMLVRLSLPGRDPHGGPRPDPAYGEQLNDSAVAGVPAEGRALIEWVEHTEELAGGERIRLRAPRLTLVEMAYGEPAADLLMSPRVAPAIFGAGLLDAVCEQTLLDLAATPRPDGVRGRVNRVWSAATGGHAIGRFGLKANVPDLRQQVAAAFLGDLGITSPVFPHENCTPVQVACLAAPSARTPELSADQLDAVVHYSRALAVPARRDVDDPLVRRGERTFEASGCPACHVPELVTGPYPALPLLANRRIHPYTDLLLHDMGEGLADGRPDFAAGGRDWRTPPLWGLGLSASINEHTTLLHDGRARNVLEAILWHGGEATAARERVRALSPDARGALLRFLESL